MANTEIDSLSLNISINGLSDKDIQNLESLSNSIAKLQRSLRRLELSKLQDIKIPEKIKGMSGLEYHLMPTKEMENFDEMFKDVQETFSSFDDTALKEAEKTLGKINTQVKKIKTNSKGTTDNLKKEKPEKKLGKSREQLSQFEKTLKRIKLISFIKLIRGAINSVIQGVQQGFNNLAMFDDSFNDTMSQLTTAKTQIFNSLALIASPLINIFQPVITMLSDSLVNIANTISLITAKIQGASTYTKINVDYMKDYAKALQKAKGFSFDTFNALDTQDNMFETATVDDEEIAKNQELYDIVSSLMETFEMLKEFAVDFFQTIGKFIVDNLDNIKTIVEQSKEFTQNFLDNGKVSMFEDLFKTIANDIFPFLIENAGLMLEMIETMVSLLKPLVVLLVNKAIVNLIKLILLTMQPINDILEYVVLPVLTEVIGLIVNILTPILQVITTIIQAITKILTPVFDWLKWFFKYFGSFLVDVVKTLYTFINPIVDKIQNAEGIFNSIKDIVMQIVNGIQNLDFDEVAKGFQRAFFKIIKFLALWLETVINFFIDGINTIIANDAIKDLVKTVTGGNVKWNGITWRADIASRVPSYANGGIVGELWQMNEYGNPEMLYNANNSGNTSVINVEQLSEAFERAIMNTGLLGAIEEGRVVYIDGKYVAQSKNFKNELNRTNPMLNIK